MLLFRKLLKLLHCFRFSWKLFGHLKSGHWIRHKLHQFFRSHVLTINEGKSLCPHLLSVDDRVTYGRTWQRHIWTAVPHPLLTDSPTGALSKEARVHRLDRCDDRQRSVNRAMRNTAMSCPRRYCDIFELFSFTYCSLRDGDVLSGRFSRLKHRKTSRILQMFCEALSRSQTVKESIVLSKWFVFEKMRQVREYTENAANFGYRDHWKRPKVKLIDFTERLKEPLDTAGSLRFGGPSTSRSARASPFQVVVARPRPPFS